jgi:hypothetical protein
VIRDISAVEEVAGDLDVLENEEVEDMHAIRSVEEDAEADQEEENPLKSIKGKNFSHCWNGGECS